MGKVVASRGTVQLRHRQRHGAYNAAMDFHVRGAAQRDAPFIVDANIRMAFETERITLDTEVVNRGVRTVLVDSTKGLYFVAEGNDRVVGQLMITFEWSDWRNGNLWWIQSVYVVPEFRRRGVFAALYRHVRQLALDAGAPALRLYLEQDNAIARQTYSRVGMHMAPYRVMEETLS